MRFLKVFRRFPSLILLLLVSIPESGHGQSGLCTPNVPFYRVNLTGNPNGSWVSAPPIVRAGSCCGSQWPDRCIEFEVTLDPTAVAINFQIASGAVPSGSMYYQLGCGTPVPVGQPICINGPGPHTITFCKPGANLNTYQITSISGPKPTPNDTTSEGCNARMYTTGLIPSTITWRDITGGGAYNGYLSCTAGCDTTQVTPQTGYPPYVDYEVCGKPAAGPCYPVSVWCDTIRIYFIPPIANQINPNPASFCANNPGVWLNGIINGGDGKYVYIWRDGAGNYLSDSVSYRATTPGTYTLEVRDGTYPGCPAKFTTVVVKADPVPIANAGSDITVCADNPIISLNGSIIGATGGRWIGGNGTYSPSDTVLKTNYTPTPAEIAAGTIILTLVSTGNGACNVVSDQIVIKIVPAVQVTMKATPVCTGGQLSTISATVTGGTLPYSYLWNTGQTGPVITQPPGTYVVTIVDGSKPAACSVTGIVTVPQHPPLYVNIDSTSTVVSCGNSINVNSTVTGGNAPYTYLWNTGATTPGISVVPGTYVVTVTDGVGCTSKDTVRVIGANTNLGIIINNPSPLCYGINAQLIANGTGGFGVYTYSWSTGATGNAITIGPGNYCVQVTDSAGCKISSCTNVYQDSAINISIAGQKLICYGSTGTISVNATGGRYPYSYSWNTGQGTPSVTVPAGTYTVTVTDANPNKCTKTGVYTISQVPPLNVGLLKQNATCYGSNNGSATASGSGGVTPYTYLWTPGNLSGNIVYNLQPGTYTVTVSDSLGCKKTDTMTIAQPVPVAVTIATQSDVNCFNGSTGSVTLTAAGGTPGYNYQWTNNVSTTNIATGLKAGTYTVSITDSKGCGDTLAITITQPPQLVLYGDSGSVSCFSYNNGSATVNSFGGSPPYTYQWSSGGSTGPVAVGLLAGSYTVTVRDAKGCSRTRVIAVTQPPLLSSSLNSTNVNCYGGKDGTATVTPAGGNAPYYYSWNTSPPQGNVFATGLSAGTYTATVTDSKGCIATSSVTLTSAPPIYADASPTTYVSCDSVVTISATGSGGNGIYTFQWSNGAIGTPIPANTGSYTVTVIDNRGCTATDTVSVMALNSNLSAVVNGPSDICPGGTTTITVVVTGPFGSYNILWDNNATSSSITVGKGKYCAKITDSGGCIYTACKEVKSDTMSVSIPTDSLCFGALTTLTPTVSGSVPPYTYQWSTGSSSTSITVPSGTYTVTIRDAISCSRTKTVTAPAAPQIQINIVDSTGVSCNKGNDGSAGVSPTGGYLPYRYYWSPTGDTTAAIFGLSSGNYTVIVTDRKGCTRSTVVPIKEPTNTLFLDSVVVKNVPCYGGYTGSVTVIPAGGVTPYNFLWWNTNNTTPIISGIPAGTYGVTIGDANGCTTDTVITITQPPVLRTSLSYSKNITCNGMNNGLIAVVPAGGTLPYTYTWTPAAGSDSIASGLSPGTYTVTIADKNGCSITASSTITQPPLLTSSMAFPTHVTCNAGADGKASVTANGGTPPYTYQWTPNGSVFASVYGLKAGTHNVKVTDANGCVVNDSVTITEPPQIILTAGSSDSLCIGDSAVIWVSATGGSGVYAFTWSHLLGNGTVYTVFPTQSTTYWVSVIDNKGCGAPPVGVGIYVYPPLTINVAASSDTICAGDPVTITATASGGNGNYSYIWNNGLGSGQGPFTVNPLSDTYYIVSVNDDCGTPVASDTFFIKVMQKPIAVINATDTSGCERLPIYFSADSLNNPPGTTYFWDFGDGFTGTGSNPFHLYNQVGTYYVTLTVTNPWGCTAKDSTLGGITVYPSPTAAFDFNPKEVSFFDPKVTFADLSTGAILWNWTFGDGGGSTDQNPTHVYDSPGSHTITLIVTNSYGCTDTATGIIYVKPEIAIYIPNAFTPNGNHKNDIFKAYGMGFTDFKMYIFDRWGDLIFVSNSMDYGWDGRANGGNTAAQADVYVYLITATDINYETHRYVGRVTLIR